jgi:hypothetical protein
MASKFVQPERDVVVLYGDGSFGLTGFDFETMVRNKLAYVGVIGNNASWNQIRYGQELKYAGRGDVGNVVADVRFDRFADAMGGFGVRVTQPEDIRPALEQARASGKPALVDVVIDRDVYSGGTRRCTSRLSLKHRIGNKGSSRGRLRSDQLGRWRCARGAPPFPLQRAARRCLPALIALYRRPHGTQGRAGSSTERKLKRRSDMRGSSPPRGARFQRALFAVALAVALGGCVAYAGRGSGPDYRYGVEIAVAPPPVRVVEAPPPRVGYVWAPGYWNWNGREHVWVEGRWLHERPGQHWVPEHWDQHNGRWRFAQGHWEH